MMAIRESLSVIKLHGDSNDRHLPLLCFQRNDSKFVKTGPQAHRRRHRSPAAYVDQAQLSP
jgi:hypothetical protein